MKYLSTLVDAPIEAYPFLRNVHFDGQKIGGTLYLPFSNQQLSILFCIRRLSKYKNILDSYIDKPRNCIYDNKRFINYNSLDNFIKYNLVFFPDNLWRYYNLGRFGKDIGYRVNLTHSERQESIRIWIKQLGKRTRDFYDSNVNDKLLLIEGVYQTIRGFLEIAFNRVSTRISRWFRNKFVNRLIDDPFEVLDQCKEFALWCEKSYFDVTYPIPELFRVFNTLNNKRCAIGRYITRSLPHGREPSIDEYVNRVGVVGSFDQATLDLFTNYVYDFVTEIPSKPITFRPSSMSSFETTRSSGGQSGIYLDIIKYQSCRNKFEPITEADIWCKNNFFADSVSNSNFETTAFFTNRQTDYLIYPMHYAKEVTDMRTKQRKLVYGVTNEPISREWFVSHGRFILLVAGCWNLIKNFPDNPISVLILKERGGKYRIPTKSLVPVQVLGGLIRSQVNHILKYDSRIRESLGEGNYQILKSPEGGLIRSQDLSLATDNYPFQVIKELYYTLLKRGVFSELPFTLDYIEWLYPEHGRPIMVPKTKPIGIVLPKIEGKNFIDPVYEKVFEAHPQLYTVHGLTKELFLRHKPQDVFIKELDDVTKTKFRKFISEFEFAYRSYISDNFDLVGIQKKGPCMGEPLSWPILPLVTCFAFDTSHIRGKLLTCGDDAAFITDLRRNELYDFLIEGLGAVINKKKDYLHSSRYLFVERLYNHGEPEGVMPFACAFSMPSLKQEQTYLTVGPSLKDLKKMHNADYNVYQRILRSTRFREEVSLYNERVVCSGFPTSLGGLEFEKTTKITRRERKIAGFISDYTAENLINERTLAFKRKVFTPVTPNRLLVEKLVKPRFYTEPRQDTDKGWKQPFQYFDGQWSSWDFSDAWDLKTQSIYGLASLSGSGPLELDQRRPTIINRRVVIDKTLKTSKPVNGDINLQELFTKAEVAMNPPLYGWMPTSSDHFPLCIFKDYNLKGLKDFEINVFESWSGPITHPLK